MRIPLAHQLRPKNLDEVVGQQHLIGPNGILRKMIESDNLSSVILFGPAGVGKTTIAEVISIRTKSEFVKFNATSVKVQDIRKVGDKARKDRKSVVVFLDEAYRMSKNNQDVFLPYIEEGSFLFVGASTENPYHSLRSALISRSQIFQLEPLSKKELGQLVIKAIEWYRYNGKVVTINSEALRHFVIMSCGDGRKVLSLVELAADCFDDIIDLEKARMVAPSKYVIYDNDEKYDCASWMQGAIQASDPDAAVFALAKWLESGQDVRYIARRIMVSASEDCFSNPEVACVAHNAYIAAKEIGRPECDLILAHAVVLAATVKRDKSAANAIWEALKDVRNKEDVAIPKNMRDCHYDGAKQLGQGSYKDGGNMSEYIGVKKKYFK